ncbi:MULTISPECIES: UDP-N-acetylmuramate--L-alanine ligase [Luteimonas]|uniref:UDP-N-acetylmuramate--L-alanine ligase n=1 Tax=Luteimonas TaxID=83614 RepID=UPI000C7DDD42|nr:MULTISPECIES: UDP-N-acetylmuramate--L-alanine ligase [Luteimonas]
MIRRLHDTRGLSKEDFAKVFSRVHFVGIGGTGMSGIAEVLCTLGYKVSGSDTADSAVTRRLTRLGATVHRGHAAANVLDTDCVVVSSAIRHDNPELMEARAQRIPIVPRAEMLAELMRFRRSIAVAGTHGKTTTTSLTASVLAEGGMDPTFVVGGQLLAAGANARLGSGDWLVAEADESDGSFLRLNPLVAHECAPGHSFQAALALEAPARPDFRQQTYFSGYGEGGVAVVTNIDADHLENYGGDFARVQAAFSEFLHRLPFYGLAVLCIDDAEVAKLVVDMPRHVMTYGLSPDADVRAEDVRQDAAAMQFTLCLPESIRIEARLALPGHHNVLNALAAAAVGWQLGVAPEAIVAALGKFEGIGRRFNLLGELVTPSGARVQLVDDYGHHPKELAAVFAAARGGWADRRLVVAFQPHRFSRTRDLFDDFAGVLSDVDALVLTEVYPAGESPIAGADAKALARAIRARGRIDPVVVNGADDLAGVLPDVLRDGDLLLMMGAGDIGAAVQQLAQHGFEGASR